MNNKLGSQLPKQAIRELAKTQITALTKVPPEHAGILQIVWIVCALVAALGVYIIYSGNIWAGLIALALAIAASIAAIFALRPGSGFQDSTRNPIAKSAPPKAGEDPWSRVTIKLPILPDQLNDLSSRLQQIRNQAQTKYAALLATRGLAAASVVQDRLRINVFLPDTQAAIYGEVCGLFIPKDLHHGMKKKEERHVRFRPNEGLTGRVFTMKKALGALRNSATSDWQSIYLEGAGGAGDEGFQLTVEQISQIDPELRWIVSFPLQAKLGNALEIFGVLNIDGLVEPLIVEEMQSIYYVLKESVGQFSGELFKLDKRRVTITVEDIKAATA